MGTPAWLSAVMKVPCQIVNRVENGIDEYGNVAYAEETITTTCFPQPASAEEIQNGRAEVGTYMIHFSADLAGLIDGFSRVVIDGVSFEADGPPQIYPDLDTGQIHHIELFARRSTA